MQPESAKFLSDIYHIFLAAEIFKPRKKRKALKISTTDETGE